MSTLCVAVRGTGSIGLRHLSVFRDRTGASVIAVPVRPDRGSELAAAGFTVAPSLQAAAAKGASLAVIASDTSRHLADATDALLSGMHVLSEKPLAVDRHGIDALAQAAARANRSVHVACNLRFNVGLTRFRERLPAVGRLHAVRIECQSYLPTWRPERDHTQVYSARADEGGVLRDLIHEIDYAVWLYGRPADVIARMTYLGRLGIKSDESADLLWTNTEGAIISIRLDYLTRTSRRRMTAFGDGGELEWDAVRQHVALRLSNGSLEEEVVAQERDDMMQAQAEAFLHVASGGKTALATLQDGAFAVGLCDAARRSALSRRAEPVEGWAET